MRQYEKRMIAAIESIANSLSDTLEHMQMDTSMYHEIKKIVTSLEIIAEQKVIIESEEDGRFIASKVFEKEPVAIIHQNGEISYLQKIVNDSPFGYGTLANPFDAK